MNVTLKTTRVIKIQDYIFLVIPVSQNDLQRNFTFLSMKSPLPALQKNQKNHEEKKSRISLLRGHPKICINIGDLSIYRGSAAWLHHRIEVSTDFFTTCTTDISDMSVLAVAAKPRMSRLFAGFSLAYK